MEFEIIITSAAEQDLAEIIAYLEANHWTKAAEKLLFSFTSVLNSLLNHPYQFPATEHD